jgi:hypothetical protein
MTKEDAEYYTKVVALQFAGMSRQIALAGRAVHQEGDGMSDPSEIYGRVKEGVHIAGYSLERAFDSVERLLMDDSWRRVGPGFDDPRDFVRSIQRSASSKYWPTNASVWPSG